MSDQVDALDAQLEEILNEVIWKQDENNVSISDYTEAKAKLSAREVAARIDELVTLDAKSRGEDMRSTESYKARLAVRLQKRIKQLEKLQGGHRADSPDDTTPTAVGNEADNSEKIKKLQGQIYYENAMYETALDYPTDTPQFHHALEQTRQRINGMYAELEKLREASDDQ